MSKSFFIYLPSLFIFSTDYLFALQIDLLPAPLQIEKGDVFFQITKGTVISVENYS